MASWFVVHDTMGVTAFARVRRLVDGLYYDASDGGFRDLSLATTPNLTVNEPVPFYYETQTVDISAWQNGWYLVTFHDDADANDKVFAHREVYVNSGTEHRADEDCHAIEGSAIPTASSIASAVWTNDTRELTGSGPIPTDVWMYSARELTGFGTLVADTAAACKTDRDALIGSPTSMANVTAQTVTEVLDKLLGTNFDETADSLHAIRSRGDSAWISTAPGSVELTTTQVVSLDTTGSGGTTLRLKVKGSAGELPTSVSLKDSTGTYGIRRADTGETVVSPGTSVVQVEPGHYEYDVSGLDSSYDYEVVWEIIFGGQFYYLPMSIPKRAQGIWTKKEMGI